MLSRDHGTSGANRGRVLVTGGAGFVGSHVVDELLLHGYAVRVLDNLDPQVHGAGRDWPGWLDSEVELVRGDVRDAEAVRNALRGVEAVFHFAAAVGVDQSTYEIERCIDVNNRGTAVLLEALCRAPVARLVVASSMGVYGEGQYCDGDGRQAAPAERSRAQLEDGQFEIAGADGKPLLPTLTPEDKPPRPSSVHALSRLGQERLSLMVGATYGIPTVVLRLFNVYGERQALSNLYTGVLANFAARYLARSRPLVYEDGGQRRDFVNVHDVAQACRLALEAPSAPGHVFNVGSGESVSVLDAATALGKAMDVADDVRPHVTHRFRVGDVRHCFADIGLARLVLGYRPRVSLETGLRELGDWVRDVRPCDHGAWVTSNLAERGLQW